MISLCTSDTGPSPLVRRAIESRPRPRPLDIERIEALLRRGIRDGYAKHVPWSGAEAHLFRRHWRFDLAMDCEQPYEYTLHARFDRRCERGRFICIDVRTRCRKCDACLERRKLFWQARALTEFDRWPCSYMVTLTLAPEMHYFYDAKVRDAFSAKHKIQAANGLLSDSDLFKYRALVIGREVTKYLKRIRKRARCRYLLVAEAHSEPALRGRPHFHLLLHELEIGTLVKRHEVCEEPTKANGHRFSVGELYDHAFIRTQWEHGWTTAKRADSKSVFYLCKYLVKSLNVRVRASEKYGNDFEDKIPIERCEDRGKLITGKEKSNGAASAEMDVIGVD